MNNISNPELATLVCNRTTPVTDRCLRLDEK